MSWTGGGSNSTRLSNWLDPGNTGVTLLSGFNSRDIKGPSLLCTSNTYRLASIHQSATANWTFSPANLVTQSSGSGTSATLNKASGSTTGKGTLTFTINRSGETIATVSKEIWIGPPSYDYISGPLYTPNNQWAFYTAQPNNPLMSANYYHTWILNPVNGNVLYPAGRSVDIAFYNSGDYQLIVRGQNACGVGPYRVTGIHVYDAKSLTITPNPATNEALITIIGSTSEEKSLDEIIEWDLEVYNSQQMLINKTTKIRGNQFRLQTTGWRIGTYIVRVIHGNDVLNEKLLIVGY